MRWSQRGSRASRLAWAVTLFATFPVVWWLRPLLLEDRVPICFFRIATTKPCPFCGLTRALAQATHGEFGLAWKYNPLWAAAAALIVVLATLMATDALACTRTFDRTLCWLIRWRVPAVIGLTVFGLWRALR